MQPDLHATQAADDPTLQTRLAWERSRSALFGVAETVRIGRFSVQEVLGRGAMGIVYAAHDPKLERRIALKVVRLVAGIEGAEQRDRLLREARAMAQLSHPNVVPVYEVIEIPDGIAIAMELVEGQDLAATLERPAPWRERLRLLIGAGRGLVAAHDAGLVHRDFKPHNVLVGRDGRARVTDFGLATVGSPQGSEVSKDVSVEDDGHFGDSTRPGSIAGTPAYIAPEVWGGAIGDARSDQYAFAVTTFEALYGERPFAGGSIHELAANVLDGSPRAIRIGPIPRRVHRAVLRGLARDPDDRFPSLAAMLDELGRVLDSRRLAASVVAVTGVGIVAAVLWTSGPPACPDAATELAEVWDDARADAIGRAFEQARVPNAEATWTHLRPRLDRYRERWIESRREACEAAHVRGEQSARLSDLRMACLDRGRGELSALVDQLQTVDAALVDHAIAAAEALPSLDRCDDAEALRGDPVEPPPAELADRVQAAVTELARVRAMVQTGRGAKATQRIEDLVADATELGYTPLLSRALAQKAFVLEARDAKQESRAAAEQAFRTALEAKDDPAALDVALHLVLLDAEARHHQDADRWLALADALVRRQSLGPLLHGRLLVARAYALRRRAEHEAAETALNEAATLLERAEAPVTKRVDLLLAQCALAQRQDRWRTAEPLCEEALGLATETLGASHSTVAKALQLLAGADEQRGDLGTARRRFEDARAIFVAVHGPRHSAVAEIDRALVPILLAAGEAEEALRRLEPAIAVFESVYGKDGAETRDAIVTLLGVYNELERNDELEALATELLATIERTRGENDVEVTGPLFYLTQVAAKRADYELAEHRATRTLERFIDAYGEDNRSVVQTLMMLAMAEAGQQDFTSAMAQVDRALAIQQRIGAAAVDVAQTQTAKAHILEASGDNAGARAAAEAAIVTYREAGPGLDGARRAVETWVATRLEG